MVCQLLLFYTILGKMKSTFLFPQLFGHPFPPNLFSANTNKDLVKLSKISRKNFFIVRLAASPFLRYND